jgi:hypothetical protein
MAYTPLNIDFSYSSIGGSGDAGAPLPFFIYMTRRSRTMTISLSKEAAIIREIDIDIYKSYHDSSKPNLHYSQHHRLENNL